MTAMLIVGGLEVIAWAFVFGYVMPRWSRRVLSGQDTKDGKS